MCPGVAGRKEDICGKGILVLSWMNCRVNTSILLQLFHDSHCLLWLLTSLISSQNQELKTEVLFLKATHAELKKGLKDIENAAGTDGVRKLAVAQVLCIKWSNTNCRFYLYPLSNNKVYYTQIG